MSLAPKKNI